MVAAEVCMRLSIALAAALALSIGSVAFARLSQPTPLAPCEAQAYAAIDAHLRARLPRAAAPQPK
jgi:hypothetical protein